MHITLQKNSIWISAVALIVLGLAIHDTKIDTMASIAALPVALLAVDSGKSLLEKGIDHTHQERSSFTRTVSKNTSWTPRIRTQGDNDSSYKLAKKVPRGHHAFDNYMLPVVD